MAVIDVAGYVSELKNHAIDHGLHVHDERHFVETYSLRQAWEVDVHPDEACGGPLDLHLSLEVDPRILLAFEDLVSELEGEAEPAEDLAFQLIFNWSLPPLPHAPDLLVIALDLAGIGGLDFPIEVSAADTYAGVGEAPERRLSVVGRYVVPLAKIWNGEQLPCWVFERSIEISQYLLERAPAWLEG